MALGLATLATAPGCRSRALGAVAPAPALRRGVNIHHMLNWPAHRNGLNTADYVWPPFATEPYALAPATLDEIVARGFSFVRLTVDPSIFLAADQARRAELSRIVMSRVDRFLGAGLEVVVDLHPVAENPAYPPERLTAAGSAEATAYAEVVQILAADLSRYPPRLVALELMNEPHPADRGGAARWRRQQASLYAAARRAAPDLAIVVCGANWSSSRELTSLDLTPYRGGNVIFTFHYYTPHTFTHAGMRGALPEYYIDGLAWPPNPAQARDVLDATAARIAADPDLTAEQKAKLAANAQWTLGQYFSELDGPSHIVRDFDEVADWAKAAGVPATRVLVGEFGAYRRPDEPPETRTERLAWLKCVRRAAEERSFGWAVWVLHDASGDLGSIGILPDGEVTGMDPGILHALGLLAS